jgi:hypothetical protein
LAGLALSLLFAFGGPSPARAAPGLCIGPVCGDGFQRSPQRPLQLQLRLSDQRGHHERITVDCRDGRIIPEIGSVERGYGAPHERWRLGAADRELLGARSPCATSPPIGPSAPPWRPEHALLKRQS